MVLQNVFTLRKRERERERAAIWARGSAKASQEEKDGKEGSKHGMKEGEGNVRRERKGKKIGSCRRQSKRD